jgi:hypothetical protein
MIRMVRLDQLNDAGLTTEQKIDALAAALQIMAEVLGDRFPDGLIAADGTVVVPVDYGQPCPYDNKPAPAEVPAQLRRERNS